MRMGLVYEHSFCFKSPPGPFPLRTPLPVSMRCNSLLMDFFSSLLDALEFNNDFSKLSSACDKDEKSSANASNSPRVRRLCVATRALNEWHFDTICSALLILNCLFICKVKSSLDLHLFLPVSEF